MNYYVYILSNRGNNVLYVGVTRNLKRRIIEHKHGMHNGFTKKYKVCKLIYFEQYSDIKSAIAREKQIKAGSRKNKISLIEKNNPTWKDLYNKL
jgi:putative endonuclease